MNVERPVRYSRRHIVKLASAAGAVAATARHQVVGAQSTPAAGADFDWRRFNGETITALMIQNPRTDLLVEHLQEFQDLTGITVNMDVVPEQQQRQKQVIEFTSGNASFDVTTVSWHVQKGLFGRGQWLADLRPMLDDPTLTASDFNFDDFAPAAVTYATQPDGRIDTMPQFLDYWILYWNKDIFAQKGIAFPENLDQLVAAAEALHDPDNGIFGIVARGIKNANVPVWTCFMQGWGAQPVDAEGQLQTTTDEAVAAAEVYKTLLANYAPPGVNGFNWNECQTAFSQGTAAMWFDGAGFARPLEDPAQSKVVGKVGYGLQPAGPVAHHSGIFGDGIGVVASSEKQGPAYFFCQWAANQENQARILATGAGAPARMSAYSDPAVMENLTVPEELLATLVASGEIGLPSLPAIVPVTEFRDVFGVALTNMIFGGDVREELEIATEQFQPILEESQQG
ncbi:MAG: extracellular solute-binding protein [Chloroflexota bacterium]|nr:extracellular solute-binding protein [Chloroflexota bacterium]